MSKCITGYPAEYVKYNYDECEKKQFTCPLPTGLVKYLLNTYCKDNVKNIIDLYSGSGKICKVAKQLGYSYLGTEIDPEIYKMSETFINS